MAIAVDLNVGPQGIALGDGTDVQARAGRTGDLIISELHGRYFEQMRSNRMYSAVNQAAQALSAALATAYTGLLLYNPVGSNKLLVPNKLKFAQSAAPATFAAIGLLGGFAATGGVTAQTVAVAVQSNQIGNIGKGVGIALSSATIVTPTYVAMLQDQNTTTAVVSPMVGADLEGVFGLLPGAFIGFAGNTVATGFGFISWEEVDLPL
jgi:hypothetical protein